MVVGFGIAAAAGLAGAYNWATNLYSYNRNAFMTDIQVEQEHAYQEDNLRIAMHEMDREEVRDLMQNCINKINNTILVTTLILSLAGEMLFEGQIPPDCAPFVLNAYMLCLGSAIFHLVLSIVFGLFASSEAYETSTHFLTRRIKPQWKENFQKMRRRKRCELTQAFEEKPLTVMLKPALAGRCHRVWREMWRGGDHNDGTASAASFPRGVTPGNYEAMEAVFASEEHANRGSASSQQDLERQGEASSAPTVKIRSALRRGDSALQASSNWKPEDWEEAEKDWLHFTTCMFKCVSLGTKNLLEACSYLCIATLYGDYKNAWVFWATQIIFTSLNVLMMHFFITREKDKDFPTMPPCIKGCLSTRWLPPCLVALIPATGPMLIAAAATVPIDAMDCFLIPVGYLSHVAVLGFFFSYFCHANNVTDDELALRELIESESGEVPPSLVFCAMDQCCNGPDLNNFELSPRHRREESEVTVPECSSGELYTPDQSSCSANKKRRRPPPLDTGAVETERNTFSARSTCPTLCTERTRNEELPPPEPKTPRTRARSMFVMNTAKMNPGVRAMPDFMLCRGLFILMLLWVSALIWALHNAYTKDFRDRKNWPQWMEQIFSTHLETLEVENFRFRLPSPYFQPHAVTCPVERKFFLADRFRVFELLEADAGIHAPRHYPCDVNGTISDLAAVCSHDDCWPVVLLDSSPPEVYDCKQGKAWPLLQAPGSPRRLATRGTPGGSGLDVIFVSEMDQVVQYAKSERRRGFRPEWVVVEDKEKVLALDVVDNRLVIFKSNGRVEYQDLDTGTMCGEWSLPAGQKVIGGGCARGDWIHILVREGRSVHILKSKLPEVAQCQEKKGEKPLEEQEIVS